MLLDDSQASEIVRLTVQRLQELGATDVLSGLQESRRVGVEEAVPDNAARKKDEVGSVRRRPPTETEVLFIALERLKQRIFVVPEIARSLEVRLGQSVEWRVDPDFVDDTQAALFEAQLDDLRPEGLEEAQDLLREIEKALNNPQGLTRG